MHLTLGLTCPTPDLSEGCGRGEVGGSVDKGPNYPSGIGGFKQGGHTIRSVLVPLEGREGKGGRPCGGLVRPRVGLEASFIPSFVLLVFCGGISISHAAS